MPPLRLVCAIRHETNLQSSFYDIGGVRNSLCQSSFMIPFLLDKRKRDDNFKPSAGVLLDLDVSVLLIAPRRRAQEIFEPFCLFARTDTFDISRPCFRTDPLP